MRAFLDLDAEEHGLSEALGNDIGLLDGLLGKVLVAQEGKNLIELARQLMSSDCPSPEELFDRIPALNDPTTIRQLARAFTLLFQLVNTAEQKEIVRVNRKRQGARRESIYDAVVQLKASGLSASQVQDLINRVEITPTLTAHPTEAKRKAVLDKLQSIALLLADREGLPSLTGPLDTTGLAVKEIERTLTELWQTDEMRARSLTVFEEVRNALYFFERTIMEVVPWLHEDLANALEEMYPGHAFEIPTILTYRSWVGGDRDGNPNVTPELTWRTLLEHRILALEIYRARVEVLRKEFTQSVKLIPVSQALLDSVERDLLELPYSPWHKGRYTQEPYVVKLLGVEERLKQSLAYAYALSQDSNPADCEHAYTDADELLANLQLVQESLVENRAADIGRHGRLGHLIRQVQAFGFHMATLDVRQHSDEHARALNEILSAAGVLPANRPYQDLSETDKIELLSRELGNPRPLLPVGFYRLCGMPQCVRRVHSDRASAARAVPKKHLVLCHFDDPWHQRCARSFASVQRDWSVSHQARRYRKRPRHRSAV